MIDIYGVNIYQKDIFRYLRVNKNAEILDWGCGDGTNIDNFKKEGYLATEGLDVEPSLSRVDVAIDSDSIGFLERNPQKWDVIFARQSIYYIPKDGQSRLWNAFHSALKPGGKLIIIVFNGALTSAEWIIQKDFGIQFSLNEISLFNLAETSEFKEIKVFGIRVTHRTPIGFVTSFLLDLYKNLNCHLRYLSERGIDSQNPKIFTKSITLLASK